MPTGARILKSDAITLSRITTLENNVYKITYYEIVSGASGTITPPTGATFNANEFGDSGDSILSKINVDNKPTFSSPLTAGGVVVTANLNPLTGAWTASGTYTDTSVALIYSINIPAADYANLNNFYIIEETKLGFTLPSLTNGSVLFSNGTTIAEDNANFFYNDTNNRLGIGTASPSYTVDISGGNGLLVRNNGTNHVGFRYSIDGTNYFTGASDVVSAAIYINNRIDDGWKNLVIRSKSSQTANNTEWQTSAGTEMASITASGRLRLVTAPTATANYGLVSLGSGAFDGSTSGFFTGSASGTVLAMNLASGSTSDLLNLQVAGVNKFKVNYLGRGSATGFDFALSGSQNISITGQLGGTVTTIYGEYWGGSYAAGWSSNGNFGIQANGGATAKIFLGKSDGSTTTPFTWENGRISLGSAVSSTNLVSFTDIILAGSGSLSGGLLNLNQTWNTTGNPTAIKLNVTNTASGSTSKLLDLQVGAVSKFSVDNSGASTLVTSLTTPLIIGGTTTTSPLTFKTTTGVGTTGADHIFQVGNNGATEAMRILNNGHIGIGDMPSTNYVLIKPYTGFANKVFSVQGSAGQDIFYVNYSNDVYTRSLYPVAAGQDIGYIYNKFANGLFSGDVSSATFTATGRITSTGAPTASANYGLVSLGSGAFNGVTSGFFTGAAAGTLIAGNLASGSTSDLMNLQLAGAQKFRVYKDGTIMSDANHLYAFDIKAQPSGTTGMVLSSAGDASVQIQIGGNTKFTINADGSSKGSGRLESTPSSFTNTSGTNSSFLQTSTFAAAAGSGDFRPLNIGYTLNNSGVQSGTATGIFLNATETALNSMTHNLMDLQVGGVSKFKVDNSGASTLVTSLTTPLIIGGTTTTSPLTFKTTTGVGTTGADHIFQVGNNGATEAMRILNNGNIGIGVVNPVNKLDLVRGIAGTMAKSTYETSSFEYNGDNKIGIYTSSASSSDGASIAFGQTNLTTTGSVYPGFEMQYVYSAANTTNIMRFNYIGRNSSGVVTSYATDILKMSANGDVIINGGAASAGITSSGRLGIGVSSPVSKLHIGVAPTASANYGLVSLGSGAFDGATSGFFTGSANGTLIAGNLASGSTSDLLNLQVGGTYKFKVDKDGTITFGNGNTLTWNGVATLNGGITSYSGVIDAQLFKCNADAGNQYLTGGNIAPTSGNRNGFNYSSNFIPTSGTATMAAFTMNGTINQTGGANGITRGLYINPTITAAADFRGIEVASGIVLMATYTFATLPTGIPTGSEVNISDSNTTTWGATIAGGGANSVKARWNGTNWTVVGI